MKRIRLCTSLLSFVAVLFFAVTPSAAQAHPTGPDLNQVTCWTWAGLPWGPDFGRGCFEWNGDEFWVEDTEADGYSTKLFWESAAGYYGECRNAHGADTWHKCDGTDYISEQDDVRWWMCLTDGSSQVVVECTYDHFDQWQTCWRRADTGSGTAACDRPRNSAVSPARADSPKAGTVPAVNTMRAAGSAVAPASAADVTDCTYWLSGGSWGDSCFAPNGDISWVNDHDYNGWQPVLLVETSYKENPGDVGNKTRVCVHDTWDESSYWVSCNYDHRETHCVRWWIYEQEIDTGYARNYVGPTPWIGADDGRPGNCVIE